MSAQDDRFDGEDPFVIARSWLAEAEASEPNDANAIALATVDAEGMPDVRMVLLKDIESYGDGQGAFVFYTNYDSAKGRQIAATGKAAFVMHWKSLRRQIRVRGTVTREDGPQADAYYASRALQSRIGAWASAQSQPLSSRGALMLAVARQGAKWGANPPRPPFWGGFRIDPVQIEFWSDGAFRLHDRFQWVREAASGEDGRVVSAGWKVQRLSP
ncbi:pyridoxamine 5'-phosphate oxidase [Paracoccus xiamenensis]|uniref:pyridoxamine 5'-phosphate oxidase n=1 Tax=Paracoccus xiamenensis TaxID=2714901 RepID=UPI00140C5C29|nr:pyridoxamine 5'-phosphate oxidase [Paracoccus xiamenensis]NHF72257.1 pyridoxamine 5'-phosphate oxidase [Paracoccus xiamenensis]